MLAQDRIDAIVKRHRPKGWRVRESRHRYAVTSAEAHYEKRTLYVPTLCDTGSLFLFLHECGHVVSGHFHTSLPQHREEYEAERYAIHVFRNEGVPLSRNLLGEARSRVRGIINQDANRGIKIQPHIARWAKHGGYNVHR